MKSYNAIYLEDAATNIGTMLEYANLVGLDPIIFWDKFITSSISKEIEKGNPKYLCGYSALELFEYVTELKIQNISFIHPTKYYWAGWVITKYQNYKDISFFDINSEFPIEKVLLLYDVLHETDISKIFNVLDEKFEYNNEETNLKQIRMARGFSQRELADLSNVSIRNIQMYEQRQNDINKAQIDILRRLAKVLGCRIESLLEY